MKVKIKKVQQRQKRKKPSNPPINTTLIACEVLHKWNAWKTYVKVVNSIQSTFTYTYMKYDNNYITNAI